MTPEIIYFDNAATTNPKPEIVYNTVDRYMRFSANPGRGAHRLALQSANLLFETRVLLGQFLGVKQPERIIFTPGCTYSINIALQGLGLKRGDVVLISALEHNAVMRPLKWLIDTVGIEIVTLPYAKKGIVDLHFLIQSMLSRHPRLVILSEGSNVTGETLDLRSIGAICGAHKVPLMVDAAQTAGRLPHSLDQQGVSLWCASGHKGLFGPAGAGLLYVAPGIELEPLAYGGTGSGSENFEMPEFYPDRLEAGTLPGPAVAGMWAGVQWLLETGVENVRERERVLTQRFLDWAASSGAVRIAGNRQDSVNGTATVSFDIAGVGCDQVAQILDYEFGICVRSGLHCAAAAHQTLGTMETGLVRASFSYFNNEIQVDTMCQALAQIAQRRDAGLLQPHGV